MSSKQDWEHALKIVRTHSDRAELYLKGNQRESAYIALTRATSLVSAFVEVFSKSKRFDEKAFRDACRISV